MSLFPAYSHPSDGQNPPKGPDEKSWLSNASFVPLCLPGKSHEESPSPGPSTTKTNPDSPEVTQDTDLVPRKKHKKERKEKKKKRKKQEESNLILEFTGQENYYVDKKCEIGYLRVDKLYNPACPRYYSSRNVLGKPPRSDYVKYKRYFARKARKSDQLPDTEGKYQLSEEEFLERNKDLNAAVRQNPTSIAQWVEFVNLQSLTPSKSSCTKVSIAERKMAILDKALALNPTNEDLYRVYVDTISDVFPSFEVSKILEKLLAKDLVSYTLWSAQILATQGSMARCVVPDVLKLYDKCMSVMYRKLRNDATMLKLFTSCSFFLRQAGLLEQFFALIKLALELNVSPDKFTGIDPLEADQNTLVEFEEVVLTSGLPMSEIWLRIEKLRTSFNFLPCPIGMSCTDPQRSVFNEDVCHFIYPLVNHSNSLELVFIILRLLKVPLPHYRAFWGETESTADQGVANLDAPEEMLNFLLCWDFAPEATESAESLIREVAVGPSFMSSWIGNDIYTRTLSEILLKLADCYSGRQRSLFVLLWMRFQRLLVTIDRLEGKLERGKIFRRTIKSELKREENRNEVNLFTEYALIEYQIGGKEAAESVFRGAMACEGALNADRFHAVVTFCEMWLKEGDREKALEAISCLVIGKQEAQTLDAPQKLLLVKKLRDLLTNLMEVELKSEMEKEHLILPDYLANVIKANIYGLFLVKTHQEVLLLIQSLRMKLTNKTSRDSFLQEMLYELEASVDALARCPRFEAIAEGVNKFPANMFLHRCLIAVHSAPWWKLKGCLVKCSTPQAILMLIVAARTRHAVQEDEALQRSQQLRVLTVLRGAASGVLRKNPLIWRLHLRSAYELEATLHQCRNVLFSALDECPWNKSLYMDGGVYVPHELTQLQDLIIEKQLRIYALPEELEILRSNDGN